MVSRVFLKRKVNNFKFFFCFLTNTVFVNKQYVWHRIALPTNTFCVLANNSISRVFTLKFLTTGREF